MINLVFCFAFLLKYGNALSFGIDYTCSDCLAGRGL